MRDVLVVLFWLWLLVAVGVYLFRLYRRVASGPGRARGTSGSEATSADAGGADHGAGGLGRFGRRSEPPLPEGPLEARLPRSLQGPGAPVPAAAGGAAVEPSGAGAIDGAAAPGRPAATVAEAVAGIRLPEGLLPVVEPDDPAAAGGQVARFASPDGAVGPVAEELGEELRRLGYEVERTGAGTLRATRDATTVAVAVTDDEGRVLVELRV